MSPEHLKQRLEYYRDLGIKDLYRRPARLDVAAAPEPVVREAVLQAVVQAPPPPELPPFPTNEMPLTDIVLPGLAPEGDTLERICADIGDCTRCRLSQGRNKIVFGVGDPNTKLVFVGEGPGADEDAQGIPFVGRAGQLLTQMIEGTSAKEGIPLKRADVYICNVVKCRPPENRTPEADEMQICGQFLFRQLSAIKPKAICALGSTAAKALLGGKDGVTKLRGKWHKWNDIPLMVTYHPSYLLRPYNQEAKRESWEDLKKTLHFVYD
jgi:uracil-DNA glycosylase family 4